MGTADGGGADFDELAAELDHDDCSVVEPGGRGHSERIPGAVGGYPRLQARRKGRLCASTLRDGAACGLTHVAPIAAERTLQWWWAHIEPMSQRTGVRAL